MFGQGVSFRAVGDRGKRIPPPRAVLTHNLLRIKDKDPTHVFAHTACVIVQAPLIFGGHDSTGSIQDQRNAIAGGFTGTWTSEDQANIFIAGIEAVPVTFLVAPK